MGSCGSKSETRVTSHIRLGLLGCSGTGKSTFYKQLRICHTDGFTPEEKLFARATLAANIVFGLRDLRAAIEEQGIDISKSAKKVHFVVPNPETAASVTYPMFIQAFRNLEFRDGSELLDVSRQEIIDARLFCEATLK